MNDKMPIVTLKSGLRVGNFSSPHEFKFVSGEVLAACSPERARALMLDSKEEEVYVHPRGVDRHRTDVLHVRGGEGCVQGFRRGGS